MQLTYKDKVAFQAVFVMFARPAHAVPRQRERMQLRQCRPRRQTPGRPKLLITPFLHDLSRFFPVFPGTSGRVSWIPGVQTLKMGERWGKTGKKWVKNEITGLQKTALMHALAHLGRVETAVGGRRVGRPASSSFASEKDLTAQLGRGTPLAEQASRALLQPPRPLHIPRLAPARYLSVANRSVDPHSF